MGKIHLILPDQLEDSFRKTVAIRKGLKKGHMSMALEEAVILWINKKRA
jgi:hypothetical protein